MPITQSIKFLAILCIMFLATGCDLFSGGSDAEEAAEAAEAAANTNTYLLCNFLEGASADPQCSSN